MLPEVSALHRTGSIVRIPPSDDVPMSDRVRRIVDTAAMRRLASISQLGMVALVYPGATHSRLEHSLGVYHNALRLLARFAGDSSVRVFSNVASCEAFVIAALIHDVGHWPFCHPIEDMQLPGLDEHESRIQHWICDTELGDCIQQDWECGPEAVLELLQTPDASNQTSDSTDRRDERPVGKPFLEGCLSGPIDIDKLDYLPRDSLHAGVPYGRNFDVGRLISSMCVNPQTLGLAIGEKGRTAAEMMVFARYVMFSEVYWHHAVRAATAMLQRSVFLMQNRIDLESTLRMTDAPWIETIRRASEGSVAEPLVEGLFGHRRCLYKRAAEFDVLDGSLVHQRLARRPYWWLVACCEHVASSIAKRTGVVVHPADLLIDAPPVKLEVDIEIDVVGRDGTVRPLAAVSPVTSALARQQFDNQVKKVRVFVRPDLRQQLNPLIDARDWGDELLQAAESLDRNHTDGNA